MNNHIDVFCPDCGMFLCSVTSSPLIEGKEFFCVECATARLTKMDRRDSYRTLRSLDVTFDLLRTNKGICTYLP